MPKVRVIEERYYGHERGYVLELINSSIKVLAYGGIHENYIESGIKRTKYEIIKACDFLIEWVTEIEEADFNGNQLIEIEKGTANAKCNVIVTKVIDLDSFECFSEIFGTLVVELENDFDFIHVGSKVSFEGNLSVRFK